MTQSSFPDELKVVWSFFSTGRVFIGDILFIWLLLFDFSGLEIVRELEK
jgi:hypothetical protein